MVRFPTEKRLCAKIIGEALDWLGGVVRSRFPRLSKPCKYFIAVERPSRSLVFCFCPNEHSLQKTNKNMESKKPWWRCTHAKKVRLSHILIYARNGVFCG